MSVFYQIIYNFRYSNKMQSYKKKIKIRLVFSKKTHNFAQNYRIMPMMRNRFWIIILSFILLTANVYSQSDSVGGYSAERPLVFEDSESIWPYSYLNDNGEPEGYCIDLIHLLMQKLDIPYVIRLKNHQEVLQDLKDGKADLALGLGDVYEKKYGNYGRTTITLLTQSVATPKGRKAAVKSFRDLKNQMVTVKDSGLCHHLMVDYGWGDHAIIRRDMANAIQEINDKGEGQIVWNTLTLKWLINHYHLDNLSLTPVNMPHGETKFLSQNQHLLDLIDKAYAELSATEQLLPLEQKWLYPDRKVPGRPIWEWYVAGLALLVLALILFLYIRERKKKARTAAAIQEMSTQVNGITVSDKIRFWAYLVRKQQFVWYNHNGQPSAAYSPDDFMKRYNKNDATRLRAAIERLVTQQKDNRGRENEEETLELRARDLECGDRELHDFVIDLTILARNRHKKPAVIFAAKREITKEHHLKRLNAERSLRYLSVFYNDESGNIFFNGDGILLNANSKASELLACDIDKMAKNQRPLPHHLHPSAGSRWLPWHHDYRQPHRRFPDKGSL